MKTEYACIVHLCRRNCQHLLLLEQVINIKPWNKSILRRRWRCRKKSEVDYDFNESNEKKSNKWISIEKHQNWWKLGNVEGNVQPRKIETEKCMANGTEE